MLADNEDANVVGCRICFEGTDVEELVAPCGCKGTHAMVHEKCLMRWRRLQVLQGKLVAATCCEICGVKYADSLTPPRKPLWFLISDFGSVLLETGIGVGYYFVTGGSPVTLCALVFSCYQTCYYFGPAICSGILFTVYVSFVFFLYSNSMKLSLLGSHGQHVLGLTSFGDPVEGLRDGMLLVSIGAGGPFRHTVLYVLQHNDSGSLAVVLNVSIPDCDRPAPRKREASVTCSERCGGPVLASSCMFIHNIPGVSGSQRLMIGHDIFLSQRTSLHRLEAAACAASRAADEPPATYQLITLKGISSWGSHQLEGEVRRGAWGWIRPEHVAPEDLFETDVEKLRKLWERKISSPHLQVFQG